MAPINKNHELKFMDRNHCASYIKTEQKCGSLVGFTSGAFDILHSQHINFLKQAKDACDILIVGINSDRSVKEYKGKDRPILGEQERLAIVSAIQYVDRIFIFDEPDNSVNLPLLEPDLFLKGGDYYAHKLHKNVNSIERPIIEKHNLKTEIVLIPTDINISNPPKIIKKRTI